MKHTQYTDKSTGETLTRTVNEHGTQSYRNAYGNRHRIDGPAYIRGDYQSWWVDGNRHRTDGPAVIDGDRREWWVDGKEYTEAEFNELTAKEVDE